MMWKSCEMWFPMCDSCTIGDVVITGRYKCHIVILTLYCFLYETFPGRKFFIFSRIQNFNECPSRQ